MNATALGLVVLTMLLWIQGIGCSPSAPADDLDAWGTVEMTIADQKFRLWIADETGEQAQGLMNVSTERMAPLADGTERGMVFVFDHERHLSFWMKNTIIPLDIAYVDSDGTIVKTYTMAPLDARTGQYPSTKPARFAIEVNANVYRRLGVAEGDKLNLPPSLLNR